MLKLYSITGHKHSPITKGMIELQSIYMRSIIEYGCWCLLNLNNTQLHRLEAIQTKFIRNISKTPTLISNKTLRENYNITTIKNRIETLSKNWLNSALKLNFMLLKTPHYKNWGISLT